MADTYTETNYKTYADLAELDDYELVDEDQDLRGHALKSTDGRTLGTVQRMLVDPDRDRVAALVLDDGHGIPVSEVEIRDGDAYIDPVEEARYFEPPVRRFAVPRGPITVNRRS